MTLGCPRAYSVSAILSFTLLPEGTAFTFNPFGKAFTLGGLAWFLSCRHCYFFFKHLPFDLQRALDLQLAHGLNALDLEAIFLLTGFFFFPYFISS